jgi:hypothetical protein
VVARFDAQERPEREEMDKNGDQKPDLVRSYANGVLAREEADEDFDGRFELKTTFAGEAPVRSEADSDGDGKLDVTIEYTSGKKTRQREDRNGDGKPDVVTIFDAAEKPQRIEEDSDGNGRLDKVTYFEGGEKSRTEGDRNGDGKPDIFPYYQGGAIVRQEEDGNRRRDRQAHPDGGEGRPDPGGGFERRRTHRYLDHDRRERGRAQAGRGPERRREARSDRLVQGQQARPARAGLRRTRLHRPQAVVRRQEQVSAEYRDTNTDCKIDQWSYYENTRLVRLGQDTNGDGNPDVLNFIGADGQATAQEVATGGNGKAPDKKLFLVRVTWWSQCAQSPDQKLDTRAVVGPRAVDGPDRRRGQGVATREIYQGASASASTPTPMQIASRT